MERNKILALVMALVIAFVSFLGGGILNPVENEVIKLVPEPYAVIELVDVLVDVPFEVIVEVDNGNLDLVLYYLEDNYDDHEVFEDAKEIVANIKMEDEMEGKALQYVAENWYDILDDFDYLDNELDDFRAREIRLYKVYSDDVELVDIDYDDSEAELIVEFKVKAEDDDDNKVSLRLAVELKLEDDDIDVLDVNEVWIDLRD